MSLFGDIFGFDLLAPWEYSYGNAPIGPMQRSAVEAQFRAMQAWQPPQKRLEPGIEWKRAGPRTHRVTVRTEPEWVTDFEQLYRWQTQANPFLLNPYLGQTPAMAGNQNGSK